MSNDTNPESTEQQTATEPAKTLAHMASAQAPSTDQLTATRAAHWHQDGKPLLSQSDVRDWLTRSGLVLYAPRPQVAAPAPTLVEATLGKPSPTPELTEFDNARGLLARLIADGNAVPLNLLGTTGAHGTDVPDFVVSAAVFSYIFTLRGNKAWKQSPVTSGPVKVSPLALAVYEVLAAKVMLSAADMAHQIGNEISETAILRALTELWSQLRVIPVPQLDGSATLWELATSRFTKQIKAGANAGQPLGSFGAHFALSRPGCRRHRGRNRNLPFAARAALPRSRCDACAHRRTSVGSACRWRQNAVARRRRCPGLRRGRRPASD